MRPIDADNLELHKYNSYSEAIANAPTLDYKDLVPQGEWIHDGQKFKGGTDWWHCSVCGKTATGVQVKYNFCPNCGARMKGGESE